MLQHQLVLNSVCMYRCIHVFLYSHHAMHHKLWLKCNDVFVSCPSKGAGEIAHSHYTSIMRTLQLPASWSVSGHKTKMYDCQRAVADSPVLLVEEGIDPPMEKTSIVPKQNEITNADCTPLVHPGMHGCPDVAWIGVGDGCSDRLPQLGTRPHTIEKARSIAEEVGVNQGFDVVYRAHAMHTDLVGCLSVRVLVCPPVVSTHASFKRPLTLRPSKEY